MKRDDERKSFIRERYQGVAKDKLYKIPAVIPSLEESTDNIKRVAVYARVSTDKDYQFSSLEIQKKHYEDFVAAHAGWQLVAIYYDEGISGTSLKNRDAFNKMLLDCYDGKLDMIITKNVSRFSRNVIDCIKILRILAALPKPVDVFFETEGIHSLDKQSEFMLSVLSAVAQEESHNKSIAIRASLKQRFSKGIFCMSSLFGFDIVDNSYTINETEADIVRLCFYMRLGGLDTIALTDFLNKYHITTKRGLNYWHYGRMHRLLTNEKYCGDFLAGKVFTTDYLTHKQKRNKKEQDQYFQRNHHPAIISRELYRTVKFLMLDCQACQQLRYIPALRVIKQDLLQGFAMVDITLRGYGYADFTKATDWAYESEESNAVALNLNYTQNSLYPSAVIFDDRIMFNKACGDFLEEADYIEVLLNPRTLQLAIRPATAAVPGATTWRYRKMTRLWSNYLVKLLYQAVLGDAKHKYLIKGVLLRNEHAKCIVFDLKSVVVGGRIYKRKMARGERILDSIPIIDIAADIAAQTEIVPGSEMISEEEIGRIKLDLERIKSKLGIEENLWKSQL